MGAATSPLELRLAVANGLHSALPNVVYMSIHTLCTRTCGYTLVAQSDCVTKSKAGVINVHEIAFTCIICSTNYLHAIWQLCMYVHVYSLEIME